MSVPSQQYVALYQLQQLIIEQSLGEAAANATVTFYEDSNRTSSGYKDVYELAGSYSSGYTFNNIGHTLTLGAAGTFVDGSGNDIVVYCYPYDTNGNLQLYYVTIYGSDSTFILDREAVPANVQYQSSSTIMTSAPNTQNAISNPQFVEVSFIPAASPGVTVSVTGSNTVTSIIPDWDFITSGTGTFTVYQEPMPTLSEFGYPGNAPYCLNINSSGISSLMLRQRFYASPTIFFADYVSISFVGENLSGGSATVIVTYKPSNASAQYSAYESTFTLTGTSPVVYQKTFEVGGVATPTENTDDAPTGYVDVLFTLPVGINLIITSVQLAAVLGPTTVPNYLEEPVARQQDHLFHYWQPKLNYKPIPSYTIGWDFPFNPCQALGRSPGTIATGANASGYIADQTILFQTVDSSVSISFSNTPFLQMGIISTTSWAIIQYLPAPTVYELLNQRLSAQIRAHSSSSGGPLGYINLYWTTGSLPSIGSNNSLVTSITAGVPTVAAGWNLISRSNFGSAKFQITSTDSIFGFNGWDATSSAGINSATYFAIVVSFDTYSNGNSVVVNYCSLVPGDIPTPPAPLSPEQTLQALEAYYEKSYSYSVLPGAANNFDGARAAILPCNFNSGTSTAYTYSTAFSVDYRTAKWVAVTPVIYDPDAGSANAVQGVLWANTAAQTVTSLAIGTYWAARSSGVKGVCYLPVGSTEIMNYMGTAVNSANSFIYYHYVADARLGVI